MPGEVIKMDYPAMESMEATFKNGAQVLDDTHQKMMDIANQLEDGVLIGAAGTALSTAIREGLCTSVRRLNNKYLELANDINHAMQDMKTGDQRSASLF